MFLSEIAKIIITNNATPTTVTKKEMPQSCDSSFTTNDSQFLTDENPKPGRSSKFDPFDWDPNDPFDVDGCFETMDDDDNVRPFKYFCVLFCLCG